MAYSPMTAAHHVTHAFLSFALMSPDHRADLMKELTLLKAETNDPIIEEACTDLLGMVDSINGAASKRFRERDKQIRQALSGHTPARPVAVPQSGDRWVEIIDPGDSPLEVGSTMRFDDLTELMATEGSDLRIKWKDIPTPSSKPH